MTDFYLCSKCGFVGWFPGPAPEGGCRQCHQGLMQRLPVSEVLARLNERPVVNAVACSCYVHKFS